MKDLKFLRFEATSFMGIDSSNPIVLDFTKMKQYKPVVQLSGNQGAGKSSTINALLYALGTQMPFRKENIINLEDNTIKVDTEFEVDGVKYRVMANKSRFVLERYVESEKVWIGAGEPKSTLQQLIRVGFSPMPLKEWDGKKQITYLRETFSDEENNRKEEKILKNLDLAQEGYKNANREYKRIKALLDSEPLFQDFEQNLERFAEKPTVEAAKEKLNRASEAKSKYELAEQKVQGLRQSEKDTEREIAELEEKLAKARERATELNRNILKGEAWLEENKDAVAQFQTAQRDYDSVWEQVVAYQKWQDVVQNKRDLEAFETALHDFEARKDQLRRDLLEVTTKYLPKIKGLELRFADLDNKQEGVFYQGKSLAQLSESELWGLFMQIWAEKDVQLVVIENLSSLGTDAIARLNELAEKGVNIWATQMNRKQNNIKISFTDKID